jgi:hypothetical protein
MVHEQRKRERKKIFERVKDRACRKTEQKAIADIVWHLDKKIGSSVH